MTQNLPATGKTDQASLNSRINTLEESTSFWKILKFSLVGLATIFAVLGFVADAYHDSLASALNKALAERERIASEGNKLAIAKANKDSEDAKRDAAEASARAAEAEERTAKLRVQIQHRRLSGEQRIRLRAVLGNVQERPIIVAATVVDNEALDFRDDLFLAIKEPWKSALNGFSVQRQRGVVIGTTEASRDIEGIDALSRALTNAGVAHIQTTLESGAAIISGAPITPGVLYLLVGSRVAPE